VQEAPIRVQEESVCGLYNPQCKRCRKYNCGLYNPQCVYFL